MCLSRSVCIEAAELALPSIPCFAHIAGVLKVVFATETLAAGINMPARSTVISALSRRRDRGIAALSHNELLQMAGRAGRRGFDTQGRPLTTLCKMLTCSLASTHKGVPLAVGDVFAKPIFPFPNFRMSIRIVG